MVIHSFPSLARSTGSKQTVNANAQAVILDNRDYSVTCASDDSRVTLLWKRELPRILNGGVHVAGCTDVQSLKSGQVCVEKGKGEATLRFGAITFDSAGVFVCCRKDGKDVDVIRTINVTVSAPPTRTASGLSNVQATAHHLLSKGSEIQSIELDV